MTEMVTLAIICITVVTIVTIIGKTVFDVAALDKTKDAIDRALDKGMMEYFEKLEGKNGLQ